MGRIVARKGKSKTSYSVIAVRLKGHDSVTRSFDTKGEARTWAAELEADMKNRRYKDPRRAHRTLDKALDQYLETVTVQKP